MNVINSKNKVKANFNADKLESVTFTTQVQSYIQEQQYLEHIHPQNVLDALASLQSEIVKAEMEKS